MADTVSDVLVLDFDGTVAVADVGDEICERFAGPAWRAIDLAWERRELSLDEAQRRMWRMVRAAPEDIERYARSIGTLRDGFDALLAKVAENRVRLVLASGGFDFYIRWLLGDTLGRFDEVFCNRGELTGDGVRLSFPHRERFGCGLCAVCKGLVCDAQREHGRRVTFVGDGSSDRCVLGRADRLYAVRGSKLAAECEAQGATYEPIESFREILDRL